VGRWVLNHSFMRPGLVMMSVSLAIGFGIVKLLYRS
jgi:anaerobic C4-dicarboxylate transporter